MVITQDVQDHHAQVRVIHHVQVRQHLLGVLAVHRHALQDVVAAVQVVAQVLVVVVVVAVAVADVVVAVQVAAPAPVEVDVVVRAVLLAQENARAVAAQVVRANVEVHHAVEFVQMSAIEVSAMAVAKVLVSHRVKELVSTHVI